MTHPTEQLAPYVDGALAPAERSQVEAHLATCASCRDEVTQTAKARDSLRSMAMPATPDDLGTPALAEMRREHAAEGPAAWLRHAPWLAAAAVIGLLAVTLPNIGSTGDDSPGPALEAAAAPVAPEDLRLEIVNQDFDQDSLKSEAAAFVGATRASQDAGGTQPTEGAASTSEGQVTALAGKVKSNEALGCLRTAFPGFPGTPVRLAKASFQGEPAYLAYVLEGPGAGQPHDTVSIWVASAKDCSSLSFASSEL